MPFVMFTAAIPFFTTAYKAERGHYANQPWAATITDDTAAVNGFPTGTASFRIQQRQ
jgi:hypothetical protein